MPSYRTVIANPGTHKRRNAKKTTKKKTTKKKTAKKKVAKKTTKKKVAKKTTKKKVAKKTTKKKVAKRASVTLSPAAQASLAEALGRPRKDRQEERVKAARTRKRGDRGRTKRVVLSASAVKKATDQKLRGALRSKSTTVAEKLLASKELERRCRTEQKKTSSRGETASPIKPRSKKTRKKSAKKRSSRKPKLSRKQLIEHIRSIEKLSVSLLTHLESNFEIDEKIVAEVLAALRQSIISNSACKQAAIRWGNTAASCNREHFIPKFIPRGPTKKGKFTGPQVMGEWSKKTKWTRASSLHNKKFWGD